MRGVDDPCSQIVMVNLDDLATHQSCFRVPADMIADRIFRDVDLRIWWYLA